MAGRPADLLAGWCGGWVWCVQEKEQLTQEDEEMATKQAEKAMGDEPEYKPSREEEAEDEAEEREAEGEHHDHR